MNVTLNHPGEMTVSPGHVHNGRTLVYADADNNDHALTLWVSPATAAQWIEALTPIAEARK